MYKIALLLLLIVQLAFANKLQDVSLQLKWKYQFQFAGFIIAKEKGFYKDVGLDVELKEFNIGDNIVEDIISNKSTFGISDSSLVLESIKGKPLVALMAIYQHSPYVLLGLKSSGVNNIKQLHNKNIAMHDNANAIALAAMLKVSGVKYNLQPMSQNLDNLISKKIDFQTVYQTNEVYQAKEKNLSVITFDPKDYGFDSYGDILFTSKETLEKDPRMVKAFYKATKVGWNYAFENIDEVVDLIYEKYNTLNKSKEALKYEAKQVLELSMFKENFGVLNLQKLKSISHLYAFMLNGNYDISNLDSFVYDSSKMDEYKLTEEEKEYLNKNIISINTTTSWVPFNYKDEDENIIGLGVDYWNLIAKKAGIHSKLIEASNFDEVLENIKNKKYDINMATSETFDKNSYALYSIPYEKFPIAIATLYDRYITNDRSLLDGKKVAVGRNYSAYFLLKQKYPNINFVLTKDTKEALEFVRDRKVFAAVDIEPSLHYQIKLNNFKDVKISGYTSVDFNLQIMIRDDKPKLQAIINKAINMITVEEKLKIYKEWMRSRVIKTTDYSFVYKILIVLVIIAIFIAYKQILLRNLNKKLKVEVKRQVEQNRRKDRLIFQQSKLASMGEMINNIAHQWRQPLNEINSIVMAIDYNLLKAKVKDDTIEKNLENIESQTRYMSNTIDSFRNYFRPDKSETKFTLSDIVNNTLDIVDQGFKKEQVKIDVTVRNDKVCQGYIGEVIQVLINILNNSRDVLHERDIEDKSIYIEIDKAIIIEDNAGGISNDIFDKIFEPYFTTKHPNVGTGIGLYMARMIVEDMNGSISVKNTKKGARFIIRI